ncbi:integrase [Rhizobium sp. BK181]|uniref:hypothetical protein n=1 Tax=Rhizobium sp. BK181 TaxID=2587072 RepID=UPI0016118503|nr:hypothetical protein [Rhizobium sp. BK181]MBB3314592.1 integrase [Rhizobium sp. BK181]
MGRPKGGVRAWHHEKTDTYFIRDIDADGKPVKFSLGFGKKDPDYETKIELAKAKYIAEKYANAKVKIKNQDTADVLVADVVNLYVDVRIENFVPGIDIKKKEVARPHETLSRLRTIVEYFGEMSLDDLDIGARDDFVRFLRDRTRQRAREAHAKKLAAYLEAKKKWDAAEAARVASGRTYREIKRKLPDNPGTFDVSSVEFAAQSARRYLQDLNAALTCAHERRLTRAHVKIPLTGKYEARTTVFDEKQVARLYLHAYFKRGLGWVDGHPKKEVFIWRHLARFILLAFFTGSRKTDVSLASFRNEGDRPWIELKEVLNPATRRTEWKAWLHRLGEDEIEYDTKKAPKIELPPILTRFCVKWKKQGIIYPCMYPYSSNDKEEPGEIARAMRKCFREVLGEDTDAVIHTFRHTAATMLVRQPKLTLIAIAGYLGMTVETLVNTYAKVEEKDLKTVTDAFAGMGDFTVKWGEAIGQELTETDRNQIAPFALESPENGKSVMRSIINGLKQAA